MESDAACCVLRAERYHLHACELRVAVCAHISNTRRLRLSPQTSWICQPAGVQLHRQGCAQPHLARRSLLAGNKPGVVRVLSESDLKLRVHLRHI